MQVTPPWTSFKDHPLGWRARRPPRTVPTGVCAVQWARAKNGMEPLEHCVYLLEADGRAGSEPVYKIGYSTQPGERAMAHDARLLFSIPGDRDDERRLHGWAARWRLSGEWFSHEPEILEFFTAASAWCHEHLPEPYR